MANDDSVDSDEMARDAIAAEVARQEQPTNFSNLAEDVQEIIAEHVMPELAALKNIFAATHHNGSDGGGGSDGVDDAEHGAHGGEGESPGFLDEDFVDARAQEHVSTGNHILLVLVLLVTCMLASHVVAKIVEHQPRAARYMRYINSSTISVLVGWLFGVGMGFSSSDTIRSTRKFSSELLYYMLLPPIIMEAGYTLRKRRFFSHILEISMFAVVGTVLSAVTVAWILLTLMNMGVLDVLKGATGMELIMFGSVISAVDTVSTLSVLAGTNSDEMLVGLLFGESVFNDAVVIVLARQISVFLSASAQSEAIAASAAEHHSRNFNKNLHSGDDFNDGDTEYDHLREYHDANMRQRGDEAEFDDLGRPAEFKVSQQIVINFVCVVIGSVLHGLLSALMVTKAMVMLGRSLPVVSQVLMVILSGLVIYILAEAFSLSGLMALFFYGIVVSHFNRYNMAVIARITISQSLRVLSSASETYLYAYLGMTLTVMHDTHSWRLSLCTLGAIFVGRAVAIFPLSALLNLFNRYCCLRRQQTQQHRRRGGTVVAAPSYRVITLKHQVVMWVAGLRGALSFGLSLDFPGRRHPFFVSTTIFIVLVTVVVVGSLIEPVLHCLDFDAVSSGGGAGDHDSGGDSDTAAERANLLELEVDTDDHRRSREASPHAGRGTDSLDDDGRTDNRGYVSVVWDQIHEHLVIDSGEGGSVLLNDEQLCVVVERDLVAIAESSRRHDLPVHQQLRRHLAAAGDDGEMSTVPNTAGRRLGQSTTRAIATAVASCADSPLTARSVGTRGT